MSNYNSLKATINANIRTNGNQEITGSVMNSVLTAMINTLGAQFQFAGVATPETNPGTPDANVAYIAGSGTYPYFNSAVVGEGQMGVFLFNGSWSTALVPVSKNKVDKKPGKNLFNPNADDIIPGCYLSSTGNTPSSPDYNVSGYIPVSAETDYHLSAAGDESVGNNYRAFYDANKTLISTQYQGTAAVKIQFTTPANCAYLRFSYKVALSDIMLEQNIERTEYLAYNDVGGYLFEVWRDITNLQSGKVNKKLGVNLWDGTIGVTGRYLNASGGTNANSSISISNYIEVLPDTDYHLSADGDVGVTSSSAMYLHYYDADRVYLSGKSTYNTNFHTPANCKYIRFSILNTRTEIMLQLGTTRTSYQPYSDVGGFYVNLQPGQVEYSMLSEQVRTLLNSTSLHFDSLRGGGTIAPGASVTLLNNFVKKNILLVGHIDGTIEDIKMGVGGTALTAYMGYYVELTPTTISVKRMDTGNTAATAEHGLTLTSHTTIYVDTQIMGRTDVADDNTIEVNVTLCDNLGNTFTLNCNNYWGYGQPFIINGNSAGSVDVQLSFLPKDELSPVWVFSDSYCEFTYLQKRLPYWLFLSEYTDFLLCAKGGMSQADQLPVLQNLLDLGYKPAFVVWLVGMNDGVDSSPTSINATAKASLDQFLALCESYNITPILQTTPTTPTRQHSALAAYVRTLGERYIDVEKAVGCDTQGNWYTGLLSSDDVHPTSAGSKVIFEQVLLDFPEIAVK